jgi:hypothetical protein
MCLAGCVCFSCVAVRDAGGAMVRQGEKGGGNGGGKAVSDVGGREGAGGGTGRGWKGGVDEGCQQHEKGRVWRT